MIPHTRSKIDDTERQRDREREKLQCRENAKGCKFIRENLENRERKRMGGETEEEETKGFVCVFVRLVYDVLPTVRRFISHALQFERERREHNFHRR